MALIHLYEQAILEKGGIIFVQLVSVFLVELLVTLNHNSVISLSVIFVAADIQNFLA